MLSSPSACLRAGPIVLAAAAAFAAPLVSAPASAAEVNVYSYREPGLIKPLFDAFTKETGIKVNVVFASTGLEKRIETEGPNSPADLLFTVDIGRMQEAVDLGIAAPVRSDAIEANVPAQFRDPQGRWFGLTFRARVVYASKDRFSGGELHYEDLADPKYRGKICLRSGQHMYNIALIAAMVAKHGSQKTEEWLRGLKQNLARKPSGGDREVAKDILAGICDLGLGNTYYVALMLENPEQKAWGEAVKVIFPTFVDGGTHVNISGAVLTKHAPNRADAVKLLEWLSSEPAQKLYAERNHEYPVKTGIAVSPIVASWGTPKPDSLPLAEIAKHRRMASELVDKVGFDQGPGS